MFSYITSWQNNYHQSKALAAFMSWGRGDLTHNLYDGGAIYYIALASEQDIFITENGKCVAILTGTTPDKAALLDSLVGIIAGENISLEEIRNTRLERQ